MTPANTRQQTRDHDPTPQPSDTATVIPAKEAAALLGIHHTTLYAAARKGEIPCCRIGRRFVFVRETLIEWLRGEPTRSP